MMINKLNELKINVDAIEVKKDVMDVFYLKLQDKYKISSSRFTTFITDKTDDTTCVIDNETIKKMFTIFGDEGKESIINSYISNKRAEIKRLEEDRKNSAVMNEAYFSKIFTVGCCECEDFLIEQFSKDVPNLFKDEYLYHLEEVDDEYINGYVYSLKKGVVVSHENKTYKYLKDNNMLVLDVDTKSPMWFGRVDFNYNFDKSYRYNLEKTKYKLQLFGFAK